MVNLEVLINFSNQFFVESNLKCSNFTTIKWKMIFKYKLIFPQYNDKNG